MVENAQLLLGIAVLGMMLLGVVGIFSLKKNGIINDSGKLSGDMDMAKAFITVASSILIQSTDWNDDMVKKVSDILNETLSFAQSVLVSEGQMLDREILFEHCMELITEFDLALTDLEQETIKAIVDLIYNFVVK